jgi:hypothetical protein
LRRFRSLFQRISNKKKRKEKRKKKEKEKIHLIFSDLIIIVEGIGPI